MVEHQLPKLTARVRFPSPAPELDRIQRLPPTAYDGAMYVPGHFAAGQQALDALLTDIGAADLVTVTEQGMMATFLPLLYDASVGERGALLGHLARNNAQWRVAPIGEALVIAHGVDGYVTPSYYASKGEHGRVVPTW